MEKMSARFYETVDDDLLKFAVIIAKHEGKFIFCKHKLRDTLEIPGGHREFGERIDDTAKRELIEETGAIDFDLKPICIYSVVKSVGIKQVESFGKLYFADVRSFEKELNSEIQYIVLTEQLPANWTYPTIQPELINEATKRKFI